LVTASPIPTFLFVLALSLAQFADESFAIKGRSGGFALNPGDSMDDSTRIAGAVGDAGQRKAKSNFAQNGYKVLRGIVAGPALSFLYDYVLKSARTGNLNAGDSLVPDTPCCDSDPFMDCLLKKLLPCVEIETGLSLFPTYSYFRAYQRDDVLKRHTDRNACEISLSLSVGYKSDGTWPIYVESDGVARCILL
jgi:hypothetical protein